MDRNNKKDLERLVGVNPGESLGPKLVALVELDEAILKGHITSTMFSIQQLSIFMVLTDKKDWKVVDPVKVVEPPAARPPDK